MKRRNDIITKGNSCDICQFGGRRAPKPNAGKSLSLKERKKKLCNLGHDRSFLRYQPFQHIPFKSSKLWSSQLWMQFKQLRIEASLKKSGLHWGLNPWPHDTGATVHFIYHFIFHSLVAKLFSKQGSYKESLHGLPFLAFWYLYCRYYTGWFQTMSLTDP